MGKYKNYKIRNSLIFLSFMLSSLNYACADDMRDVVLRTIQSNPEYFVSYEKFRQARMGVWQKIGEFLPVISINAQDGKERSLNSSTKYNWLSLHRKEDVIEISENIFDGMQSYYGFRESQARINSSGFALQSTAENLALSAIQAYLNVLRHKELVSIAEINVSVHVDTFGLIKKRSDIGLSSRSEQKLTSARLATARARYIEALKELQNARATYLAVVGIPPHLLVSQPFSDLFSNIKKTQALKIALINNPQIMKARYDASIYMNAYKASRSTFYPKLNFVLRRYRGTNVAGVVGPLNNDLAVLEASWNIFRGGSDFASVKKSAYRKEQAIDELSVVERDVVKNTSIIYNQMRALFEVLPQYETHKVKITFVLNAYRKQFVAGKRTLLDVLNIENELYNSKRQYINAFYDSIESEYALLNRMGLLLYTLQIENPYRKPVSVLL